MPIFDNELINNTHKNQEAPKLNLASPGTFEVDTHMNMGGFTGGPEVETLGGLSLDELSELPGRVNRPTFDSPFQMVPKSELLENKRYALYERDKDLENIYGINQSWYGQLGNGIAKMGATAAGTFAQSFATIPNTMNAIRNGSVADLAGDPNGPEADIDKWLKNIEDVFPNYVTRKEQEHPFLAAIPGFSGSANFWGNSIIKNIGFTVGAIGGALAQDAIITTATEGIGTIPLVSAQMGKAALWLNKIFTGTNDLSTVLRGVNATERTALGLAKLQQLAAAERVTKSARYMLNLYGSSRTEAAIEARDGYDTVHSALMEEYKLKNLGAEPTADEVAEIDRYATNAMNTRFGVNMALLTVSNAIQFDNILKPFTKATQGTVTQVVENAGRIGLREGSLDVFEKKAANSIRERIWDVVKPRIATVFAEGVYEEGGQYAAERGTYDYYTRKYKDPKNPNNKETWNTLEEIMSSTSKGLSDQFNTTEGIQNMMIGAISAVITGGLMGKIDNVKGRGADARLQSSINLLNNFGMTGILDNRYGDSVNAVGIAKDMEEAAQSGDLNKYKNFQHDMFFNFVSQRIPSGMHDVTVQQLEMLKELDADQFQKMFGLDASSENQKTAATYVDSMISKADDIKQYYDALDRSFQNPFTFVMDPKTEEQETDNRNYQTFNNWKTDLAYFDSVSKDISSRLENIDLELMTNTHSNLNSDLLVRVTNPVDLMELADDYEKQAAALEKTITEFTSLADKRSTKNNIKFLRTLSERINMAKTNKGFDEKDFKVIINYELSPDKTPSYDNHMIPNGLESYLMRLGKDVNKLKAQQISAQTTLENLVTQEGLEKYYSEAEKIANNNTIDIEHEEVTDYVAPVEDVETFGFINKSGLLENVEIGREYELPKFRKPTVRKISETRFRVTDSLGNNTFYPTKELADIASKDIALDDAEITRVKVIATNNDGTVKIEDKNGNIQNIPLDKLKGFTSIETEQEKLIRNNATIKEQQDKLELKSGTVTIDISTENTPRPDEGRLKSAELLFTSTTSVSEDSSDPANKSEHVKRSREFLNNVDSFENRGNMRAILVTAKQIESIGLSGLIQLSYGVDPSTPLNDIPNVNDVDNGFVVQVYVVQENGKTYFVDKNGNKLSEIGSQVSMDDVVFQTMPTTALTYANGDPRYRSGQEEQAIGYSESYREFRAELFASSADSIKTGTFNVSRGIPIENKINGVSEKNHVGGILVPEKLISTQEGLIMIPTLGVVTDNNGSALAFPNGTPVLRFGSTIQFLNNRKFNREEASTIYQVIKLFAEGAVQQARSGSNIELVNDYSTYLQNVLYWRKGSTTTGNQINIDPVTMSINLGSKNYPMSSIGNFEQEITDSLQDNFLAVNNTTLLEPLSTPFYEFNSINGIVSEDTYTVWDNYQSYLLSSNLPNGKPRSIGSTPLSTSVAQPTVDIPYSYKQKYSTFQGMELSIPKPKPTATTPEIVEKPTPVVTEQPLPGYTVNDGSVNTYNGSQAGPILYTIDLKDNIVSVEVQDNNTIDIIAKTPATLATLKGALTQLNLLEDDMSDEDIVKSFLAYRISAEAQKVADEQTRIESEVKQPITIPELPENYNIVDEPIISKTDIPTDINRFSGFNPDSVNLPDYRAVNGEGQRMNDEEFNIFQQWHADNVPNIPFEVLDRLVTMNNGEKAWGVFENGVAKFVKGGLRATEYHEIFEGIYKGFLNEEQQLALLDEFKSKKGSFTDRTTGRKILYTDATDLQAKERIADDFADFRQGKLPARSLGERIKNFFNNIINFIKSFVTKKTLKNKLFETINTGGFRENVMSEAAQQSVLEYRAVEGLPEAITHEFVQDMTARAAGILYSEGQKNLLFSPEAITSKKMFATIEAQYLTERNAQGFNKRELLGDEAWKALQIRTLDALANLGVSFSDQDRIDINTDGANRNDYVADTFTTNWKAASTGAIKFSLATLLEVVNTNQEKSISLELPKPARTSIIGFKLLNFSRTFATVLDKLSNTTKISEVVSKLSSLAGADANYVRLFQRVGGNISNRTIPFENFTKDDWRYYIQFTQTFTKQKPDALIQYIAGDEVYTAPANLFTAAKQKQNGWIENIKTIAKDKSGLITRNTASKTFKVNQKAVQAMPTKTPAEMVEFLNNFGIDFTMGIYNKLKAKGTTRKTNEQIRFAEAVQSIKLYLGSNEDIMSINGKTLGINSQLSTLSTLMVNVTNPSQESTYYGVDDQQIGAFADNNAPSLFENEFNESETLEDLLLSRPELNDIFSTNSQVLKKGGLFFDKNGKRIKEIKVGYIQGTKMLDTNKGISTGRMTIGDRFTQEINQNINGNYYVLIPADGSTEWMMNLGNTMAFTEIDNFRGTKKRNEIFKGYLFDDIAIALDSKNRSHLKAVKGKGSDLRFFKDILMPKDLKAINNMIAKGLTQEQIEDYVNQNITTINDAISKYLDTYNDNTLSILKSNNQLFYTGEDSIAYPGLTADFLAKEKLNKNDLTQKQLDNIIDYVNTNYIINNIEYHKFLFGDPLQFAVKKDGSLDETKRIKSFLSPRRTTFDSPELNTSLNQNYNKVGNIELSENDPGYHKFKPYTNTVTFADVITAGSLSNELGAYAKTNEADAASWVRDNTYREIKIKNGQWSDQAELFHQWHMAYTRQNYPGYKYTNDELKVHDEALVATKEPYHKIEVLKPIVSGNKYGTNQFDLILDKLSQMPMYYKMVQGKSMEKLYIKMQEEGIGYAIMESGRKVGAESLHSVYNPDGSFNESPFNNIIQVAWKAYGIQVETTSEGIKTQTRGSQLTKISSMDLFNNGVASSPEAKAEYENNKRLLDEMHNNAYNTLIEKLGVVDTGNGFELTNGIAVSNTLMHEMGRRAISENTKDAIQLDDTGNFLIPFEAAPSYIQIKNILYSMLDKSLISPKMSGGAHVQVPATMFEEATKGRGLAIKTEDGWKKISRTEYNKLSEEDKKKVMLTDDSLKFYTKEEPYCEMMLPHWFKGKLGRAQQNMTDEELLNYINNSVEGRKILQGIGFRIPTQALSSVEVFKVKGFLPQYMGSSVIVPSEITTKAGSDFDIDKLNMYLKSIYIDRSGDVRLIKYYGSKEANDEFFSKVFDDTLNTKIMKKADLLEAIDIVMYNLPDPKNLLTTYGDLIDAFSVDYVRNEDENDTIDRLGLTDANMRYSQYSTDTGLKLSELTDENLQANYKDIYLKKMYKSALENAYYESLEKIITLPENFDKLIQPIGDANLEALSVKLDNLRGYDESKIQNRILSRNYLTSMRNSFLTAKRWVGIAAVNITGLSLKQKSQIYVDPIRIAKADYKDRMFLGDGIIHLPHNSVNINGYDQISLSGNTVAKSTELISDRLSGYATAFVDVAKGDYITKIIQSDLAVGTFMFLENIGVGDRSAYFMNQPIISEYLKYLDSITARNLFAKKHLDVIRDRFVSDLDPTGFDVSQESLEKNISDYYTTKKGLTNAQNAEQQAILNEFLKYAKMAEYNFKFTMAINYDTSSFRSAEALTLKQWKTQEADKFNIINTASDVLNDTFIGRQARLISQGVDAMGAILKFDNRDYRAITDTVLSTFAKNPYLSGDKLETISVEIKAAFVDFIIQTKSGLNDRIHELLVDDQTAVVHQLERAKMDYPGLQLLRDLEIVTGNREDGAKSIKLIANTKDAYDENLYTGYMRELRDYDATTNALYKNLINLSILQGTYASAISIRNIIPIEDYAAIVGPIVDQLQVTPELNAFSQGMYQRNNFKNDDVIPVVKDVRFFKVDEQPLPTRYSPFGEPLGEQFQFVSPYIFPTVQSLNVSTIDRKIMLLSERYNGFELQYDFLKVPRIVFDKNTFELIDMKTGISLIGDDFRQRKLKGDQSLYDVYGYQRVKLPNGENLIHSKVVGKDIQLFHVYKLVNLYGDGDRATENYNTPRISVIDNGGVKTEEIPNAAIIEHYGGVITEKDVSLPVQQPAPILNDAFARIWENNAYNILEKFPDFTQEQYESMTDEEKDNLLGCI